MKHRRHGRHAVKSTGSCMGMLAAAVAFGLLNMGVASAAPTVPDRAAIEANRDRLVNAGQLTEEQQNKKDYGQGGVSLGGADIQVEQEQRPSLDLPDTLKVQVNDFKITGQDIYSEVFPSRLYGFMQPVFYYISGKVGSAGKAYRSCRQ